MPAPPEQNPPLTPLYDVLTTNLPHLTMRYPSFPFPPSTPLFPSAAIVLKYLQDYAAHFDLLRHVRPNTRVEEARWNASEQVWKVTLSTGELSDFDFIVVANGHYRKPRYPNTQGLQKWIASGRAIHSAWFRRASDHAQYKKVLVAGGGPSGLDISTEMRTVSQLVLHSVPSDAFPSDFAPPPNIDSYRKVPKVTEYKDNGDVVFADGTIESNVEFAILGTGYEVSFPFLPQLTLGVPSFPPPLPSYLYNSTYHIFPLAKHLFPLQSDFPAHTIAFPALPQRVAPFPVSEDQARAIVRVLTDPSALDVAAEAVAIVERARALAKEEGTDDPLQLAKAWSRFGPHEPFEYRAELHAFAKPGTEWRAPDWEVEFWDRKDALRAEWKEVVKSGQADEWVKGVGERGVQEWVDLCRRLLKRRDDREKQKAKL